jgi:hypothetical protein
MSFIRWDEESPVRVVVGIIALAVGAWVFVTTEPTNYLRLPALVLFMGGAWGLLLAVVPEIRAKPGTPHRGLIVGVSWAAFLLLFVIVGRAAVAP